MRQEANIQAADKLATQYYRVQQLMSRLNAASARLLVVLQNAWRILPGTLVKVPAENGRLKVAYVVRLAPAEEQTQGTRPVICVRLRNKSGEWSAGTKQVTEWWHTDMRRDAEVVELNIRRWERLEEATRSTADTWILRTSISCT